MSAPVRFLLVAVAGWALFRGATAGMLPGVEAFAIEPAEAAPAPPVVPTEFPPISPPAVAAPGYAYADAAYYPNDPRYSAYPAYAPPMPRYVPVPIYYAAYAPIRSVSVPLPPP